VATRVAINGFGRIGRQALRAIHERHAQLEVVALNDLMDPKTAAHLFKHDSTYGNYPGPVEPGDGAIVIDNSSTFRMRDGTPLVVPEINADAVHEGNRLFPIANCTAIILCMALAPIKSTAGLARVCVATYQAVTGAGLTALEEFYSGDGPILGTLLPQLGPMGEKRSSEE